MKSEPAKKQKKEEPKPMKKEKVEKKKAPKLEKPDPVQEKINLIENSIETLCVDPRVTDLVLKLVKPSLQDFVEDRHAFQLRTTDMINEVLTQIEGQLAETTADKQTVIDTADEVRGTNTAALEAIVAAIAAKETEITGFEEVLSTDQDALIQCTLAKDEAQEVYDVLKADRAAASGMIDLATKGQAEFDDMIGAAPETNKAGKKRMLEFTQVLKKINCDDSMMQAAPAALAKQAEDRGMFDKLTLDSISKTFTDFLTAKNECITTADDKETVAFGTIETCRTAETEADNKVNTSQANLSTANSELKQLKKDKKEQESVGQSHEVAVVLAESERDEAQAAEEEFALTFAAFQELKERTGVVPEVVEEEEEEKMEVEDAVDESPVVEESPVEEVAEESPVEVAEESPVEQMEVQEEVKVVDTENQESVNAAPAEPAKVQQESWQQEQQYNQAPQQQQWGYQQQGYGGYGY